MPDEDYGETICAVTVLEYEAKPRMVAESNPAITLQDLQNRQGCHYSFQVFKEQKR